MEVASGEGGGGGVALNIERARLYPVSQTSLSHHAHPGPSLSSRWGRSCTTQHGYRFKAEIYILK